MKIGLLDGRWEATGFSCVVMLPPDRRRRTEGGIVAAQVPIETGVCHWRFLGVRTRDLGPQGTERSVGRRFDALVPSEA